LRTSIADYEVIEPAAAGPVGGSRYLCRPPARLRLDDPVTVTELAVDAAGWQQLADHLVRLANVDGTELLLLYEVGPDLSLEMPAVYLSSETATGGSLAEPAKELEVAARIQAVAAAARGAHAMHEAGLAHGSISPSRVLLTERGAVLGPPRLDGPSGAITSFSHWSELVPVDPDLLAGEHPSRGSDIWSVGVALHSALSDRPLYPGIESDEPVTAVQRVLFTRPEIDKALPKDLVEVIRACLEPDPSARPQTAMEVAERIAGGAA
jgi:serine/threonine protein kinase